MITVWDVASGELLRAFGWLDGSYSAIFSPDGRTVLAGETPGTVALWDAESGQFIRRFGADGDKHGVRVRALTFTADGRFAASGSDDGSLILWNVESGQLIRRFVGHLGGLQSLSFSPDETMLLSASSDGEIILWDVATGEALRRYVEHTGSVKSVRFLPDGNSFVSVSQDGTLRRWRIDSLPDLLAWTYANRYVPELTCTERELYRLQPGCVEEVYPTRTPYMTPSALMLPTAVPALDPTVTPTLEVPSLIAQLGDNRGEVAPAGVQQWLYRGTAGEIITLHVTADHVASEEFRYRDAQGSPTLYPVFGVRLSNGVLIGYSRDISLENWNQILENLELPADGDYWIEVNDWGFSPSSGGYTLTIERSELPEATAEVTATP